MVVHRAGRAGPVDTRFLFQDLLGIGRALLGLRCQRERPFFERVHGLHHERSARIPQHIVQFAAGHIGRDGDAGCHGHGPGVEPFVHLHHHHAGFCVTGHDRALDGRSPPPARQKRGVTVETAKPCAFQNGLRKKKPVSDHNGGIGFKRGKGGLLILALERFRRPHLDPERFGRLMNGRFGELQSAPPCRSRRLRIDGDDLVPGFSQCLKGGKGEIRSAHEDETKCHAACPMRSVSQTSAPALLRCLKRIYPLTVKPCWHNCLMEREMISRPCARAGGPWQASGTCAPPCRA